MYQISFTSYVNMTSEHQQHIRPLLREKGRRVDQMLHTFESGNDIVNSGAVVEYCGLWKVNVFETIEEFEEYESYLMASQATLQEEREPLGQCR
jgi:hypothetical protein